MGKSPIKINFAKMTGAGNDFVLVDAIEENLELEWTKLTPILCNRRYGVGADGLLVLEKSIIASFKMNYFNADGSFGGMCGNGGRCSAKYMMEKLHVPEINFEALDYVYRSYISNDEVGLHLKDPKSFQKNIKIQVLGEDVLSHFIDTGAPHLIVNVHELPDRLQKLMLEGGIFEIGKALRYHPHFAPGGVNVDFIQILSTSSVTMRTYERGVENETLACGTGAVASAVCSSILANLKSPVDVITKSEERLKVTFHKEGTNFTNIILTGSAYKVFQGYFYFSFENNCIYGDTPITFEQTYKS